MGPCGGGKERLGKTVMEKVKERKIRWMGVGIKGLVFEVCCTAQESEGGGGGEAAASGALPCARRMRSGVGHPDEARFGGAAAARHAVLAS